MCVGRRVVRTRQRRVGLKGWGHKKKGKRDLTAMGGEGREEGCAGRVGCCGGIGCE